MTGNEPEFGRARKFFWPIRGKEVKKFLPMSIMMFFILFNYTMLRNTKDALVVTAVGPEALPFLKGVVILPVSILFVAVYARLLNTFKVETVFYIGISTFVVFFALFALYILPNQAYLLPDKESIQQLKIAFPYLQHIISLYGSWVFALFYLFAELWGAIVLGLLFWQFANEITRIPEAKRFYAMFGLLGHFALVVAGLVIRHFCTIHKLAASQADACDNYVNSVILMVIVSAMVIMAIYRWMNLFVLTDPKYYDAAAGGFKKEILRPKFSLVESFKHIATSKYIGLIAVLVLGYGFSMNILGLIWKKQLKLQYPDPLDYSMFMGDFSFYIGLITIALIFFFKGTVARFGWFKGAIVTPMVLAVTGVLFFGFIFFGEQLSAVTEILGYTPLLMTVFIGTSQQILSKCAKYAMFDPTKEMAYIPLDQELKTRGKAAVDVIGNSFSKASGGYVVGGLLLITAASDLMTVVPMLVIVVTAMIITWVFAVSALYKRYKGLVSTKDATTPAGVGAKAA